MFAVANSLWQLSRTFPRGNEIAFSTRVLDEHFFQSINPVIMNFQ